jgi:hypothetical protein
MVRRISSGKADRSKPHPLWTARNLHLGLELLERRCMLAFSPSGAGSSALQPQPSVASFGIAPSAAISTATPAATVAASQPASSDPTTTQTQQIFFTVSLLYSGAQVPILPYERIVVPAPLPGQPQPFPSPGMVPEVLGLAIPAQGARPILAGGSGGDSSLSSANSGDAIYGNTPEDNLGSTFGNRAAEGPSSEVPAQEMIDQLSGLGEMDDLMGNDVVPPTGISAPGGAGGGAAANGDMLEDQFDLDSEESGHDSLERDPLDGGGAALRQGNLDDASQPTDLLSAIAIERGAQFAAARVADSEHDELSQASRLAVGMAIVSLTASGDSRVNRANRFGRCELKPKR